MIVHRYILSSLFIYTVAHAAKCPSKKPKNGSKCSVAPTTTCKYDPKTCPGSSKSTFRTSCKCVKGKFKCSTESVGCGQNLSKCPEKATPGGSCSLGLKCRYDPVGCIDVVKFATTCACNSKDGKVSFECSTDKINCATNDSDCPTSFSKASGKACDPAKVKSCNYTPFGCPGGDDPGTFIQRCTCDASLKEYMCRSVSALPCD
jgi:hypothetical protein